MRVDKKACLAKMVARLLAEPADHLHAAIRLVDVDKRLTAEVVIEVHLVPVLDEPAEALVDRLDPDGLRVLEQESLGSTRDRRRGTRAGARREIRRRRRSRG